MVMVPHHDRQRNAQPPVPIEAMVDRGEEVVVDGFDLVVMPRDFADGNIMPMMPRLILVDELVAQIEAGSGFGPGALNVPVGVDGTERRAATGIGRRRHGQRHERSRQGHGASHESSPLNREGESSGGFPRSAAMR